MKLSTNKLFTSSKKKKTKKVIIRPKKSCSNFELYFKSDILKKTDIIKSHKKKQTDINNKYRRSSKKNHTLPHKVNPFNGQCVKLPQHKTNNLVKKMSAKEHGLNLDFLKTQKDIWNKEAILGYNTFDNDINNILLTSCSDSNPKIQDEYADFDLLCDLFNKNSKLKTNIIIDNSGNNNLNPEQEKFIKKFLNKKEKLGTDIQECKINDVKVQNYNHNNILLKTKNYPSTKINRRIQNDIINKRVQYYSSKDNNNLKDYLGIIPKTVRKNNRNINNDDEIKENNSVFEECTNKSLDSSFLGSSFAEDLFMTFKEVDTETKNLKKKLVIKS